MNNKLGHSPTMRSTIVSNSQADHRQLLLVTPIHRRLAVAKFSSPKCRNGSHDPDHAHLGNSYWLILILHIVNSYRKFELSSFCHSRDFGGGSKISKMGYVTRITPFSGMMFHQQAGTCYGQLINQIWSLYLHQLWRYEKRWKMKKLGRFGAVTGHSRSSAMSLFDRTHTHSYSTLIKTMNLSCTIFVIKRVICRKSSIFTHPTCIWHPQLNSADIFGARKLESLGCHVALFAWFYI